jgi:transcriptional regulator with XRE-family HTH domain
MTTSERASGRGKRRSSAYDEPTEEKRAFGRRLRNAREIAGISLTDAATRLGYSQPVQMSNMENGIRPATLKVIIEGARLYGTTADYLCGMAEDFDPDPSQGVRRQVAALVLSDFEALARTVASASRQMPHQAIPSTTEGQRMAGLILEAHAAASTTWPPSPARGILMEKLLFAADAARAYLGVVKRTSDLLHPRAVGVAQHTDAISRQAVAEMACRREWAKGTDGLAGASVALGQPSATHPDHSTGTTTPATSPGRRGHHQPHAAEAAES